MIDNLLSDRSYVNGEWLTLSDNTFHVTDPGSQDIIATIADDSIALCEQSIEAAHSAFSNWKNQTAKERALRLEKLYDLIIAHKEPLAQLMTRECGKPIQESRGEVVYAANFIKWFAEEGKRAYGDVIPPHTTDRRIVVVKQPIGVVVAITPWNFPLAMITRKIAPALAVGCTVIIRPTEETPLSALALARLAEEAGFPPGVINVVVGSDASEMGKVFCASPKVKKISFTGSTRVGHILMEQCAPTLKKLSLELGGNAPFIIFEDADLDAALTGLMVAKYRNAGQTCVCVNKVIVHESLYDEFLEKFKLKVEALQVGYGLDEGVHIGPMINEKAISRTKDFIADAIDHGGHIVCGGQHIDGRYFQPTIIGDANRKMRFAQEEIFGPIAPVYKCSSDQEAIEMANDTVYGLAAYFYSENVRRCWKVAEALDFGMVGINEGLVSTEVAPFGGVKYSGQGREGSKYGLDDYLEIKYMCYGNIN